MTHPWNETDDTKKRIAARAATEHVSEDVLWVTRYERMRDEAKAIIARVDSDPEDCPREADVYRRMVDSVSHWLQIKPWNKCSS